MCGRKACTLAPSTIVSKLGVKRWSDQDKYHVSYNIAPTQSQPVVYLEGGARCCRMMKWGFVPASWTHKTPPEHTTNARAEGLLTNGMWRAVVHQKRCIVIASGFFEWKEHKRPHYIHPKDDEVMALAGLYDVHKNAESAPLDGCRSDPFRLAGEEEWTYSVVTVQASQEIEPIHDRMPVILDTDEKRCLWLGEGAAVPTNQGLAIIEVSQEVSNVRNNSPDNLTPLAEFKKVGPMDKFFLKGASPTKPLKRPHDEVKPAVKSEAAARVTDAKVAKVGLGKAEASGVGGVKPKVEAAASGVGGVKPKKEAEASGVGEEVKPKAEHASVALPSAVAEAHRGDRQARVKAEDVVEIDD